MASHPHPHHIGRAVAVALAGLALAAPASNAGPPDDEPVVSAWPHTAESTTIEVRAPAMQFEPAPGSSWGRSNGLIDGQVLPSRGQGAPSPPVSTVERAAKPGFDWFASLIGAGAAGLVAAAALATSALVNRRRPRAAA